MLNIVGGVYLEHCMYPEWREIYGSAGRAASALAALNSSLTLHGYVDEKYFEVIQSRAAFEKFSIALTQIPKGTSFDYVHGLSVPRIDKASNSYPALKISGKHIVQFGMIESHAVVQGDYVVYDPQNVERPEPFDKYGSQANHLAIIANRHEASVISGETDDDPKQIAKVLAKQSGAEVIVLKLGPLGALVYHDRKFTMIPAYYTSQVWKIGSGDIFVAHFSHQWLVKKMSPVDAAMTASKAAAYYCLTRGFPNTRQLKDFNPTPVVMGGKLKKKYKPLIYLAGPFFTLAQRWLIEQLRDNLSAMGLRIFSPFHDVGHGTADAVVKLDLEAIHNADVMLAVGDGMDSGTVFEVGYARALLKPVVIYCENESEENRKMMVGSGCLMHSDYVSAVYATLWAAMRL